MPGAGTGFLALAVSLVAAAPAQAVYAGANGLIAFDASPISTVEPDGTNPAPLQPGTDPSWSPTGSRIAYACTAAGVSQVCEMGPDGSGSTTLTINGGKDPGYTPGGDVVFVRASGGHDQVFTMSDEGGEIGLVQRTSDPRDHEDPTFSATGGSDGDEEIAYSAQGDIWTMEIGQDPINITHRYSLGDASHPDYSPDGSEIVLSAGGKLYVIATDGSSIRQLTDPERAEGEDLSPVFSPDGTRIAFSRAAPGAGAGAQLMLIDANGGDVESITEAIGGVTDVAPSWQAEVPPLFEIEAEPRARSATCPANTVLVGGGHSGIDMGANNGDDEGPTANGWAVAGTDSNLGYPPFTYATCGSPDYWETSTQVWPSPLSHICGAFWVSAAICAADNDQPDTDWYVFDVQLEAPCPDGWQVLAGGFVTDPDGSGETKASTVSSGRGGWLANGFAGGVDDVVTYQSNALCLAPQLAANPPIAFSSRQEGPIIDPSNDLDATWIAYCPNGSYAVAGGWQLSPPATNDFNAITDNYPINYEPTDYGTLPTAWSFRQTGAGQPTFYATAICAVPPSGLAAPQQNGSLTYTERTPGGSRLVSTTSSEPPVVGGDAAEPQWAPDASGFVFARSRGGGTPELLRYDDLREEAHRLLAGRRLFGASGALAPGLRSFAFARRSRGGRPRGVFVGTVHGGRIRELTGGRGDRDPAWSPDGTRLAFTRGPRDAASVWTVEDEGGPKERLTPRSLSASEPDYSPHGDRVAVAGRSRGCAAIYSIVIDGSDLERLTPCGEGGGAPAWSPNGERIAYAVERAGGSEIRTIEADGGGGARVVARSDLRLDDPDWRPYPGRSGPLEPR
ncbi:MAG TPA: hypothetical protein VFY99_03410 [Solirubrobacterales bacterium]